MGKFVAIFVIWFVSNYIGASVTIIVTWIVANNIANFEVIYVSIFVANYDHVVIKNDAFVANFVAVIILKYVINIVEIFKAKYIIIMLLFS